MNEDNKTNKTKYEYKIQEYCGRKWRSRFISKAQEKDPHNWYDHTVWIQDETMWDRFQKYSDDYKQYNRYFRLIRRPLGEEEVLACSIPYEVPDDTRKYLYVG